MTMKLGSRFTREEQAVEEIRPDARGVSIRPEVRNVIAQTLLEQMNVEAAGKMGYEQLVTQLEQKVADLAKERRFQLNLAEQQALAIQIADDMTGVGPLEPLMRDEAVTDIMVNGPRKIYIERAGKLILTGIEFRDEPHLNTIARRMASYVGRRLDESSPLVDARLADGSRVNIVIPPIAIDGTTISIRRFSKHEITLETLVRYGSMSEKMKQFLELAAFARLNILISGGTSSGKTTLMNAISRHINNNERIITIEDAAELKFQQPHVIRLETRPASIQGSTEVNQRMLVANALRMRPDRIILGEVRSGEAFDLLQAMNTGHEGSMGTMHANTPRDALSRMESMILMAGFELPIRAIRNQIASSVNLIVQAERMVDGVRRVSRITEITGIEGDQITSQDLFQFETSDNKAGVVRGEFVCNNVILRCVDKLKRFGVANDVRRLLGSGVVGS